MNNYAHPKLKNFNPQNFSLEVLGPNDWKANRLGNMNLDLITNGDILQHKDGRWFLLVERLGLQSWTAQELAIEPNQH